MNDIYYDLKRERKDRKSAILFNSEMLDVYVDKACAIIDKNIDAEKVKSSSRKQDICTVRNVCIFIGFNVLNGSKKKVGEYFNRDHTSVINSLKSVDNWYYSDKFFREKVKKLLMEIEA